MAGLLRNPEEKNVQLSVKPKALCQGLLFPSLMACLSFLICKMGILVAQSCFEMSENQTDDSCGNT